MIQDTQGDCECKWFLFRHFRGLTSLPLNSFFLTALAKRANSNVLNTCSYSKLKMTIEESKIAVVDLFCGIGGLSFGLKESGIEVLAGVDTDEKCKYPFEKNNRAKFINKSVTDLTLNEVKNLYPKDCIKVLAGCAPCQTFSQFTVKNKDRENDPRWGLLYSFGRLVKGVKPHIVSMENVTQLRKYKVFDDFIKTLTDCGYEVYWKLVYCPKYGIPQRRRRLVLLASKFGKIELLPETHDSRNETTVRDAIGEVEPIKDGEVSKNDPLHRSWTLSPINKKRMQQSVPNGTWHDWDKELRSPCHRKKTGKSYKAVYARMGWDGPSPTITTQFFSFGTGRFGHPEQDRALSLREGALLQTFPKAYVLHDEREPISFNVVGKHVGNAVPVQLGTIIGKSILAHVKQHMEKRKID
jgi:DNA (cytosine-5)-methyltransferase 1